MPPSLAQFISELGIQNVHVTATGISCTFEFANMGSEYQNLYLEAITPEGFHAVSGSGSLAAEWDSKGALEYLAIYADAGCVINFAGTDIPLSIINEPVNVTGQILIGQPGVHIPTKDEIALLAQPPTPVFDLPSGMETPGDSQTTNFGLGDNQTAVVSTQSGTTLEVNMDTKGPVKLNMGIWDSNPTTKDTGFDSKDGKEAAIYFVIEVDNLDNVIFPIRVTITLPGTFSDNLSAQKIKEKLKLLTWDDAAKDWKQEKFDMTVDPSAGTVTIAIQHLSVFAIGQSTSTDHLQIPGFSLIFLSFAGVATILALRRKLMQK